MVVRKKQMGTSYFVLRAHVAHSTVSLLLSKTCHLYAIIRYLRCHNPAAAPAAQMCAMNNTAGEFKSSTNFSNCRLPPLVEVAAPTTYSYRPFLAHAARSLLT